MTIDELKKMAEDGNVAAQAILGISYLHGIDVEVDLEQAFRLLSAASKRGASRAMANLAEMYRHGLATPKDMSKALRLYEKAASRGEFFAQIELGRIYGGGLEGITPDLAVAEKWYSAAAEQKVRDCDELEEAKAFLMAMKRNRGQ
jgi:TPR repeat protein